MLKAFLDRRRTLKTLGNFVSPEIARQIADGSFIAPPLSQRAIEFAFVTVPAADAQSYSERAGVVAELAFGRDAVVHSLLPVVVIGFGIVDNGAAGDRVGFVADLNSRVADAAVVHGSVIATVGSFGGASRLDVGFWWPGMGDALRQLARLSPGDADELR